MIKDVFVLSKTSWHCRLMHYIWKLRSNDFSHICPYFWLSVFNVIIILPWAVIKSFFQLIGNSVELIFDSIEKMDEKRFEKWWERAINSAEGEDFILRFQYRKWRRFSDWLYFNNKDESYIQELNDKRVSYWDNYYENSSSNQNESSISNKDRINNLLKIVKPVSIFILYILALGTLFFAGYGIVWIFSLLIHLHTASWIAFFKIMGWVILCIIGIVLLIFLIAVIAENVYIGQKTRNFCSNFFGAIGKPFVWLGTGVYLLVIIIINIFKNNCPAIKWKD